MIFKIKKKISGALHFWAILCLYLTYFNVLPPLISMEFLNTFSILHPLRIAVPTAAYLCKRYKQMTNVCFVYEFQALMLL